MFSVIYQDIHWEGVLPSVEKQLLYFTDPANWVNLRKLHLPGQDPRTTRPPITTKPLRSTCKEEGQWRRPGKKNFANLLPTTTPARSIPHLRTSPWPKRNSSNLPTNLSNLSTNSSIKTSNQPSSCSAWAFSFSLSLLSLILIIFEHSQRTDYNATQATLGVELSLALTQQRQYTGSSDCMFYGSGGHFRFSARENAQATARPGKNTQKMLLMQLTLGVHPWWPLSPAWLAATPKEYGKSWRRLAKSPQA